MTTQVGGTKRVDSPNTGSPVPGAARDSVGEGIIEGLAGSVAIRAIFEGALEAGNQKFDRAEERILASFERFDALIEGLVARRLLETNPVDGELDFEAHLNEGFAPTRRAELAGDGDFEPGSLF